MFRLPSDTGHDEYEAVDSSSTVDCSMCVCFSIERLQTSSKAFVDDSVSVGRVDSSKIEKVFSAHFWQIRSCENAKRELKVGPRSSANDNGRSTTIDRSLITIHSTNCQSIHARK